MLRKIKVVLRFLVVFCCVSTSLYTMAQPSAMFILQLSASASEIRIGEDTKVTVTLRNISDHNIKYAAGIPWPFYQLQVLDAQGNKVKETSYGMKVHGTDPNRQPFFGSVGTGIVEPGSTMEGEIDLAKEYDLSVPGEYIVSASRVDPETHILVKSNKIQVTVLPPK